MFDRSTIERALTRVGLALNRTLVATQRERDQAIQERDQAVAERKAVEGGKFDKFPAALIAAEASGDDDSAAAIVNELTTSFDWEDLSRTLNAILAPGAERNVPT